MKALFKVMMTHAVGFLSCFNVAGPLTNHKKAGVRAVPPLLCVLFRVVPSLDPESQICAGSLLPSDKTHLVPAMESNQGGQSRERWSQELEAALATTCMQPAALLLRLERGMWLTDAAGSQD